MRLFDYDAVKVLYELCVEEPVATVKAVTRKSKSKWRPLALDTVVGYTIGKVNFLYQVFLFRCTGFFVYQLSHIDRRKVSGESAENSAENKGSR